MVKNVPIFAVLATRDAPHANHLAGIFLNTISAVLIRML